VDVDALEPLPGPPAHQFSDRPAFYREVLEKGEDGWGAWDDGHGVPCVFRWPAMDAMARTALQATAGMIRFLDDRVGAILDRLEARGDLGNTFVIFTSDHGEMHGHHGYWGKGLMAFEDCQRVPLLISGPGVTAQGSTEALANLVDLPRTILSLVGCPIPAPWQGVDLKPVLENPAESVQDMTLIECEATHHVFQRTAVTATHKLVVYRGSEEGELYDLENDPCQLTNLWGLPAHEHVQREMLERIRALGLPDPPVRKPRKAFA
jgi:arylsulfatase A-like enzyme